MPSSLSQFIQQIYVLFCVCFPCIQKQNNGCSAVVIHQFPVVHLSATFGNASVVCPQDKATKIKAIKPFLGNKASSIATQLSRTQVRRVAVLEVLEKDVPKTEQNHQQEGKIRITFCRLYGKQGFFIHSASGPKI